jgi:hypothetical protein
VLSFTPMDHDIGKLVKFLSRKPVRPIDKSHRLVVEPPSRMVTQPTAGESYRVGGILALTERRFIESSLRSPA